VRKRNLAAMVAVGAIAWLSAVPPSSATTYSPAYYRERLTYWVNLYRAQHGLRGLAFGNHITSAAVAHSISMARHHYFSHTGWTGWSWIHRLRYYGTKRPYLGENLAVGNWTPEQTFLAWRASAAHRPQLLSTHFRWIGVGMALGTWYGHQAYYVTTDFSG
jgi:uncharacterized protein YkwD